MSANDEARHALAEQYARRHTAYENYILNFYIPFKLLRRLHLEPSSWQGRLIVGLYLTTSMLLPAFIVTAITGQWATAPVASWLIVAVAIGLGLGLTGYDLSRNAATDLISFYQVMADETGQRRLIAWDCRWFSIKASMLAGGGFMLGVLIVLTFLQRQVSGVPVPPGTIALGLVLFYQVGENAYVNVLLGVESRFFASYDYDLYRMSPIDSVAVRRSLRGYNRLALLNSAQISLFIIAFVILLPAQSNLAVPIALILLLVVYLGVAFGTIQPRLSMERVIRSKKEQEMESMQSQVNEFLQRLSKLSEEEYEEMRRLEDTYDRISSSSENLLPLGTIARTIVSLLLPTVTVLVTTAAEEYLSQLMERFLP